MGRFEGKVAVVTGGNSGIGLATAKAFAREGASVAITGRDEATLRAAEQEIGGGAMALRADSSRMADLDAVMHRIRERFRKIDALFVNAGSRKVRSLRPGHGGVFRRDGRSDAIGRVS